MPAVHVVQAFELAPNPRLPRALGLGLEIGLELG